MKEPTDPTRAPSARFSRRAFVGLGAGAVALGASAARAKAADDFGKPHPPLVPESDRGLVITRPKIAYGDRTLDAYAAEPADASKIAGAIVVVAGIYGVDSQLRDTVRRFAKQGYVAVAPDLYTGLGAPNGDGATDIAAFRPIAAKLVDGVVDRDLAATAAWALHDADPDQTRKLRVGITGFCMGGGIVLRTATLKPTPFSAAAVWYGDVRKVNPADIKVPLLGSFGAKDTSIPADAVRDFTGKLDVPYDFRIYKDAGHAFFDDTRATYVATAATEGWDRALAWFGGYLRAK